MINVEWEEGNFGSEEWEAALEDTGRNRGVHEREGWGRGTLTRGEGV